MPNSKMNKIFAAVNEYCAANHNFNFDPKNPVIKLHEPTFGAE